MCCLALPVCVTLTYSHCLSLSLSLTVFLSLSNSVCFSFFNLLLFVCLAAFNFVNIILSLTRLDLDQSFSGTFVSLFLPMSLPWLLLTTYLSGFFMVPVSLSLCTVFITILQLFVGQNKMSLEIMGNWAAAVSGCNVVRKLIVVIYTCPLILLIKCKWAITISNWHRCTTYTHRGNGRGKHYW